MTTPNPAPVKTAIPPQAASRDRSPNYPQINIAQAIERTRKIYHAESRHAMPDSVAAGALGYTSLNGTSKAILSSLKKFGLLAKQGENSRVSDDALAIIELPANDPESVAARSRCAFKPSAFKLLRDQFGESLPSDANVRHFLLKNGYQSDGANQLMKVYKDTLQHLAQLGVAAPVEEKEQQSADTAKPAVSQARQQTVDSAPPANTIQRALLLAGTHQFRFRISPECDAEIHLTGEVTREAIDKLIRFLELSQDDFPQRSQQKPARRDNAIHETSTASDSVNDDEDILQQDNYADDEEDEEE